MTATIVTLFVIVYIGMILGGLPFVQLDRTGIALLGAIAMISVDALNIEQAALSIHLPTLILLFSFMVLSAQMGKAGPPMDGRAVVFHRAYAGSTRGRARGASRVSGSKIPLRHIRSCG